MSILFWLGIIFLIDASIGLLFFDKWKSIIKTNKFDKIIWLEILLSFILLSIFFIDKSM